MFGKNRIAALQAELDALKEQLKLEKEFSEGRELLLKLIGVDIQKLEAGAPLTCLQDTMDHLGRAFALRVKACKVDIAGIHDHVSPKFMEWSDEILQNFLCSEKPIKTTESS